MTDILSGEQRITFSAIKPLLKDVVYDKILVENDDDATLTREIGGSVVTFDHIMCCLSLACWWTSAHSWMQGLSTIIRQKMSVYSKLWQK